MIKKCYYLLAVPIICLFFGTTAFAGETFSWLGESNNIDINYISSASVPLTDTSVGSGGGDLGDYFGYAALDWKFNNTIQIIGQSGKFVYGVLYVEYDIYIPNPNSSIYSKWAGTVSVEPYISETLKVLPMIASTTTDHYKYRLEYIFDGYQVQNSAPNSIFIGSGEINIKMRVQFDGPFASLPNVGVNPTGTASIIANNLRFESTPLNHGLAALFAEGIDYSDKVDLMLQYLYDIKMNDIGYYNTLTSNIASILSQMQNIDTRLRGIMTFMISGFDDVQTVLDLFPSYRTQVLQYWQQLLEMNATESSAAAALESQYQDKENQSASLAADLGSLNMPSISVGDLDILARTDATQKANFFGLLSIITNNNFITTLLLIVCTGAIVGFILYGKKS